MRYPGISYVDGLSMGPPSFGVSHRLPPFFTCCNSLFRVIPSKINLLSNKFCPELSFFSQKIPFIFHLLVLINNHVGSLKFLITFAHPTLLKCVWPIPNPYFLNTYLHKYVMIFFIPINLVSFPTTTIISLLLNLV